MDICGVPTIGYPWIPPSPFRIKHWEKSEDRLQHVDLNGALASGQDGQLRPFTAAEWSNRGSIKTDLANTPVADLWVTHSPPRAQSIDTYRDEDGATQHAGSEAIRDAILRGRPAYSLHGHFHDAESITGQWCEQLGGTCACNCGNGSNLRSILIQVDDGRITGARLLLEQ